MQAKRYIQIRFCIIIFSLFFLCASKFCFAQKSTLSPNLNINSASFKSAYSEIYVDGEEKGSYYGLHMSERAAGFYSKVAKNGWREFVPEDRMQHFTISAMPEVIEFIAQQTHNKKILSVGSGRAELEQKLAIDNDLTCVDAVEEMVEHAKRRGLKAFVSKTEQLKFPDEEFDLVILPFSLPHFKSTNKILAEAKRVLKKNGKILIINPQFVLERKNANIKGNGAFRLEQIVEFVHKAGFDIKYSQKRIIFPDYLGGKMYNVNYVFAVKSSLTKTKDLPAAEYFSVDLMAKGLRNSTIEKAI